MYKSILVMMMEGISASEDGIYGIPGTALAITNEFENFIKWYAECDEDRGDKMFNIDDYYNYWAGNVKK